MATSKLATSVRFREHTRAPYEAPVRLQFDSFVPSEEARSANISLGGLFVACREPRPVGTRLRFELELDPDQEPVIGIGEVVWIRVRSGGPGRPSGMGVEFRAVPEEAFHRLRRKVELQIRLLGLPTEPEASAQEAALHRGRE